MQRHDTRRFLSADRPPFLADAVLSGDRQKVMGTRVGQYVDSPFQPAINEERHPAEPGPVGAAIC